MKKSYVKALFECTSSGSTDCFKNFIYYEEQSGVASFTATDNLIFLNIRGNEAEEIKKELSEVYGITPDMYSHGDGFRRINKNQIEVIGKGKVKYPMYKRIFPKTFKNHPQMIPHFGIGTLIRYRRIHRFLTTLDTNLYCPDWWNDYWKITIKFYGQDILLGVMPCYPGDNRMERSDCDFDFEYFRDGDKPTKGLPLFDQDK